MTVLADITPHTDAILAAAAAADSRALALQSQLNTADRHISDLEAQVDDLTAENQRLRDLLDDGTPPPPPPQQQIVLYGASSNGSEVASKDARYGPMKVIRRFHSGDPSGVLEKGRSIHVSFKTDMASVVSGAASAKIAAFMANQGPDPLYVTLWHEHDVKERKGGFDLALWKQAWAAFVKIPGVRGPNRYPTIVLSAWTFNTDYLAKNPGKGPGYYLPADGSYDVIGVDCDGLAPKNGAYHDFLPEAKAVAALAQAKGVRWSVPEFGWPIDPGDTDHSKRNAAIKQQTAAINALPDPPVYVCLFESHGRFPLYDLNSAEDQAWKAITTGGDS